jgi:hypothetical protein
MDKLSKVLCLLGVVTVAIGISLVVYFYFFKSKESYESLDDESLEKKHKGKIKGHAMCGKGQPKMKWKKDKKTEEECNEWIYNPESNYKNIAKDPNKNPKSRWIKQNNRCCYNPKYKV